MEEIFLIEDDPLMTRMYERVLRLNGFSFTIAQNGKEALRVLREAEPLPRLVLLDIMMPEKNGLDVLRDMKQEKVLLLTGDEKWRERYHEMLVEDWYLQNLVALGPHSEVEAGAFKAIQLQRLLGNENIRIKVEKKYWEGFKPRIRVELGGERVALMAELETLANFIALENDTVRRTALIELAMKKKGIDVDSLPKTPLEMLMPQQAQVATPPQAGAGLVPPQTA